MLRMKIKIFLGIVSTLMANMAAMAMQPQMVGTPVQSISLMTEIDQHSKKSLNDAVKNGLNQAKSIVAQNPISGHLHINKLDDYHLTVGTFEAINPANPLMDPHDKSKVWNEIGKDLRKRISIYNQKSHVYKIYLFVHGYDGMGNRVDYHYSTPEIAKSNIRNHFDIKKGIKLTHFHIVARHGTSFAKGPKGPFATDCEKAINHLISLPGSKFKDANSNASKGLYYGHITLAVMKRKAGKVTANSQRFGMRHFDAIIALYKVISDDYSKNTRMSNGKIKITLNKFYTDHQ